MTEVTVTPNGPLLIKGPVEFTDRDGNKSTKEGTIAICRCGATKNQPYCDGSHIGINFKDGE
ncbi:MAG: CDGSH iron-sulfur domain-containing protein [Candidatus Azobacteroides sp.]|nr:CDGSH iron-sulfur domain-containing protein [Candidatus Azobacteroides sp.]